MGLADLAVPLNSLNTSWLAVLQFLVYEMG